MIPITFKYKTNIELSLSSDGKHCGVPVLDLNFEKC